MNKIKNFDQYPFIREAKTQSFQKLEIYKYNPVSQLFFLVTPTLLKTPKVLCLDEAKTLILKGKFIQCTKSSSIYEKINKSWENWSEEWEYDGKRFTADYNTDLRDAPWHHGPMAAMKIGYYHGKLVWVTGFQYMPRVCYCKFESIYKKPSWEYVGYTNIRNIKPVYCFETNSYI